MITKEQNIQIYNTLQNRVQGEFASDGVFRAALFNAFMGKQDSYLILMGEKQKSHWTVL